MGLIEFEPERSFCGLKVDTVVIWYTKKYILMNWKYRWLPENWIEELTSAG